MEPTVTIQVTQGDLREDIGGLLLTACVRETRGQKMRQEETQSTVTISFIEGQVPTAPVSFHPVYEEAQQVKEWRDAFTLPRHVNTTMSQLTPNGVALFSIVPITR